MERKHIIMSGKEINRIPTMKRLATGEIKIKQAAETLGFALYFIVQN
ncbi:hypothetical protein KKG52_00175 [Patescibacteria group bacterium]|nr:hypothetical protein [Patescibacteria group bacterium]